MLTLNPAATCDVCAEEYGPRCMPHTIPCGHVLCRNCCNTIIEKTPQRLTPVCPFCRETFSSDSIRLIRIDFSASRWNTPRISRRTLDSPSDAPVIPILSPKDEESRFGSFPFVEPGFTKTQAEARQLEHRVAQVATKKCSVEEVTNLHRELQEWLDGEEDQNPSLALSAALLHAILMNHFAHAEASKQARDTQMQMKAQIDDLEMMRSKLQVEIARQERRYAEAEEEIQQLRAELARSKGRSSSTAPPPLSRSSSVAPSATSTRSSMVSPMPMTPPSLSVPNTPSSTRTATISPTSRSSSTAPSVSSSSSTRSHVVSPTTRAASTAPSLFASSSRSAVTSPTSRSSSTAPPPLTSSRSASSSMPPARRPSMSSSSAPHTRPPSTSPIPPVPSISRAPSVTPPSHSHRSSSTMAVAMTSASRSASSHTRTSSVQYPSSTVRSATPAAPVSRSKTPAAPTSSATPTRTRRMSNVAAPAMMRSASDDSGAEMDYRKPTRGQHEIWMPRTPAPDSRRAYGTRTPVPTMRYPTPSNHSP